MKATRLLLSIGTAGALLLPAASFAQDSTVSDEDFLNTFLSSIETNDGVGTTFDARAFTAHPCFNAVGQEQEYCLQMFGITTDFETMVDENMFSRLLIEQALEQRCGELTGNDYINCRDENDELLPTLLLQLNLSGTGSVLSENDDDEFSPREEREERHEEFEESRRDRMERLWELCASAPMAQAACYQNYIGTINRATISELEELFGVRSDMPDDEEDMDDDNDDVRSDVEDENALDTRDERAEWLWDLCADSSEGRTMCYRHHYRTAISNDADLMRLEADIRG